MTDTKCAMPNITIWTWMQTVLHLNATELLIFAYLFTKTFDNVHRCYTSLDTMSEWFGMTRQALSRHITKMCDKGVINRVQFQDKVNPIIKHNSYAICIAHVTELCEKSDSDSYKNFLDSYRYILQQKFPQDSMTIDEYMHSLEIWHNTKEINVCVTIGELSQLICNDTTDSIRLTDLLSVIKEQNRKLHAGTPYEFIGESRETKKTPKKQTKKTGAFDIIADAKKPRKRTSNKAKKEEWLFAKQAMSVDFVNMRVGGNTELLNLLNSFLETANGMALSPQQWMCQLDEMYALGITAERMIEGVRRSFMNNYKSVYYADKAEKDIAEKLKRIKEYVDSEADGNEELRKLLESYVLEVPKGKSSSISMFNGALENLSEICKTTPEKISSVKTSYINGYAALAYHSRVSTNQINRNSNTTPIEIDEKKATVERFIIHGYYQLVDGLRESLYSYIENTPAGMSMTNETFRIILNGLRLYCLNDAEKVNKVQLAIQNNSVKFAYENFEETRQLQVKNETRESMAKSQDRNRRQRVEAFKRAHPDDIRVKDIIIQRREAKYV